LAKGDEEEQVTEMGKNLDIKPADGPLIQALSEILGPANVSGNPLDRIAYSRDVWPRGYLWLRAGELPCLPDAVVWPRSDKEVSDILKWCNKERVPVTPEGGGSGVCGGAAPLRAGIVMDMKKMNRVIGINSVNLTVEAQAGIVGEDLERQLMRRGLTLGHFPASMYCSTLGGWLATRSAGQLSTKYGKIEDMLISLAGVLPDGAMFHSAESPRSATGPDLDLLLVGSEGTLAVITSAVLAAKHIPAWREYRGFMFQDMESGVEALRAVMQAGLDPSVTRLYDPVDTKLHQNSMEIKGDGCLMIMGFEGPESAFARAKAKKGFHLCARRGQDLGTEPGEAWLKHRYSVSYYQSVIMSRERTILDTCEVAAVWSRIMELYNKVRQAIMPHAMVTAHISHLYSTGAAIYFTFVSQGQDRPPEDVYAEAWSAAMRACLEAGGTISHHHGIGAHKAAWMPDELGPAMELYRRFKKNLDPNNILNPGKMGL